MLAHRMARTYSWMRRGLTFDSKQSFGLFDQLLNDVEFDLCNASANHSKRLGGRI
jgi:hypothetical protein